MPQDKRHLVWLDMEMSGLDPGACVPLEIATLITDSELRLVATGPSLIISQPDAVLDAMDAWNTQHHTQSGLVDAVRRSHVTLAEAEERTLRFLMEWVPRGRSPLCGNSISQDRRFLRRYLPRVDEWLHYRNIDVSTIKELAVRWYGLRPPRKRECHRALDDIRESIEELRVYRAHLFRPEALGGDLGFGDGGDDDGHDGPDGSDLGD